MSDHVQCIVRLPLAAKDALDDLARSRGLPRSVLVRQMIGFAQVMEEARQRGHWVGVARDREVLDTVLIPPS